MDRSFQGATSLIQSPFSPRCRQNISVKRSLASPLIRKSSRFSVSGKSAQSGQIIIKSPYHYIERFGQPLPILITEALTFVDRNTVVSARIADCGYAWVVCGRRLLIWQYRQLVASSGAPQKKHGLSNQCFELQLPQSDLSHRAELVAVFLTGGSNIPACIAVSPEGVVRYWPAITNEGTSVEQSIDLQGQECYSLTDLEGLGCILATTTCSVVLVQPQFVIGRHSLTWRPLKAPTGWFGGISRRMSSLIFGPISEHSAETKLVRVLSVPNGDSSYTLYVLAGHTLQKWHLSPFEPEQLIFVTELNRTVRDHFHSALWDNHVGDQSEINTWMLDIQADKDYVIILAAGANMQLASQIHYALLSIKTNTVQPPTVAKEFKLLKLKPHLLFVRLEEQNQHQLLNFRFLLSGGQAYVYDTHSITVFGPQEEPDILEFKPQEVILGGYLCVNTPILFSRTHGLVSICSNETSLDLNLSISGMNTPLDQSFNETLAMNNLSVYNMDPVELQNAYKDSISQMKAAFIFYVKHQQNYCMEILQELFPHDVAVPAADTTLDKVTVMMCLEILNDIPASDPRWKRDVPLGIGSSYSMQIVHQLEDKQKAQSLFLRFLKETGLWGRLRAYTVRGTPFATVYLLGEFSEKITAALQLKNRSSSPLLEKAIEKAVEDEKIDTEYGLTMQDAFYCKVAQIERGVRELVNYCEDLAHSDLDPVQVADSVQEVNEILLNVINEVIRYRKVNSETFTPSDAALHLAPDFLPWTSASGAEGLADSLWEMHSLTYNYGIKITTNLQARDILCEQLVAIADLILDGRKSHIDSIRGTPRESVIYKQYCLDRYKLIRPLLNEKEFEKAAQLAEKYLDFEALVQVCEWTDNQGRLDEYMERFDEEGFSEYVYNWYLKENKQGKLIDRCRKIGRGKNIQKLTNFLSNHPNLSWMQQVFDKRYSVAAGTLRNLADYEKDCITRQKTMYSLAKLCKLAGPNAPDCDSFVEEVNTKLDLIAFQEDVPDYVLQQFGYDTVKPRVISAEDLINLYICPEYKEASEVEFKKALDLLQFISDEELREEMRLKIWRQALLRDSWNYRNVDYPLEILQNTLFFKIVDFAFTLEGNQWDLLPELDLLIEDSSLAELLKNKNFLFLIKTGYDHIYRTYM